MAQQCIWASAPGRTGNLHISGQSYKVRSTEQYDRAAVCDGCGGTIGVFIDGKWFYVLRLRGGRVGYQEAPFTQFGEQRETKSEGNSGLVETRVRAR